MANIKSAKKKISVIDRRRAENKYVKATISTLVKKLRKLIEDGKIDEAEKYSKEVYSYIDSACSKGVIHKNNASRKVGRLAEMLYKAKATVAPAKVEEKKEEVKVEEVKAEEVKAEETKPATKKTTATKKTAKTEEKPAAKKTTTKKATTKKAE